MAFEHPRHPAWMVILLAVAAGVVWLILHGSSTSGPVPIGDLPQQYKIPPTFGSSRSFFAGVLALMMATSVLAFGAVIENVRFLASHGGGWREPARVSVLNETLLLLCVVFGIVPDVLVLMSWGELMAPPYALLSKWDRAFDGISAFTFLTYIILRLRSRPVLLFQLQRGSIPADLEPTWHQLRPKLAIVMVVTIISFGVAFAK